MGARGNSGVILCQILRGLATTVSPRRRGSGRRSSPAASRRRTGRRGPPSCGRSKGRSSRWPPPQPRRPAASRRRPRRRRPRPPGRAPSRRSRTTPELLPVLAAAGVVDAGGAGLVLLFDALLHVVDGRPLPDSLPLPAEVAALVHGEHPDGATTGGAGARNGRPERRASGRRRCGRDSRTRRRAVTGAGGARSATGVGARDDGARRGRGRRG